MCEGNGKVLMLRNPCSVFIEHLGSLLGDDASLCIFLRFRMYTSSLFFYFIFMPPHNRRPPTVPERVYRSVPTVQYIFLYMEEFQTSCERASSDVLRPWSMVGGSGLP